MPSALAVALGLALVPLSGAWKVERPPCRGGLEPFVSAGCFRDGEPPALVFRSGLDRHDMTVDKCVAECKGKGFRYAGLEHYGVCFCGSAVNGARLPDAQCSLPCSGNGSETCSGDGALSVWQDPTFARGPGRRAAADYRPLGCFTDDSPRGRALPWPVQVDGASFTTNKCLAACEKGGFPFAGTEYGGECWCGVVLANDTAKVHESECGMHCRGDGADKCGGRSRLSLYVAEHLRSREPCRAWSSPRTAVAAAARPWYRFPNTTAAMTRPWGATPAPYGPGSSRFRRGGTASDEPVDTATGTAREWTTVPRETTPSSPATTEAGEASGGPGELTATASSSTTSVEPGETTTCPDAPAHLCGRPAEGRYKPEGD